MGLRRMRVGTVVLSALGCCLCAVGLTSTAPAATTALVVGADAGRRLVQTAKLVSPFTTPQAAGTSVADSGSLIAVGAPAGPVIDTPQEPGAVYVFRRSLMGWSDSDAGTVVEPLQSAAGDLFGFTVAFAGPDLVVGAAGDTIDGHTDQGAVYVFAPTGLNSWTQVAQLTASNGAAFDELGSTVVAENGLIVTASAANQPASGLLQNSVEDPGAVYVFQEPAGGWANATQTAELTASDAAADNALGSSLAVEGSTIVAGAPRVTEDGDAQAGALYVYNEPSSGWRDAAQTAKLVSSDPAVDDSLGNSLAMSGTTIVAGADGHSADNGEGAVEVFSEPAGGWVNATSEAELTDPLGPHTELGYSVALSRFGIVAGAPGTSFGANTFEGAVEVFPEPARGWTSNVTPYVLEPKDAANAILFGSSVTSSGHDVTVGARNTSGVNGTPSLGGVYVFTVPLTLTARQQHAHWHEHPTQAPVSSPLGTRFVITTRSAASIVGLISPVDRSGSKKRREVRLFARTSTSGTIRIAFAGRLPSGRLLPPGRYRLNITATSGEQTRTATLAFTVEPSKPSQ